MVAAQLFGLQCTHGGGAAMLSSSQFCSFQCGHQGGGGELAAVPTSSFTSSLSCKQFNGDKLQFRSRSSSNSRGGKAAAPSRGRLRIDCVGWDPENILSPPQPGHIARRSFEKQYNNEEERKIAMEDAARGERERRRVARGARIVPSTHTGLVEFFLETEGQEMEYEIARCRPRLNENFFSFLKSEIGLIRFGLNPPKESEDRLVELEALQKVLAEGVEAYDKLAANFTGAKDRLEKILLSKDKRATLLELAGDNLLDRPLLALLDENIAAASNAGQKEAAEFMGKIRGAMLKYMIA